MEAAEALYFDRVDHATCSRVGLAARLGDEETLRKLLREGAPCDVSDNRGWFPIHEAANNGNYHCIQLLAANGGIDLNSETNDGETALFLASARGHVDIVTALLEHGALLKGNNEESSPLVAAVKGRSLDCVKVCVENGCDVNGQDVSDWSVLHEAAYIGSIEIMDFLLNAGAAINIRNRDGATVLFTAVQFGHFLCLQLLMRKGADIDLPTVDNTSPLFIGAQEGHSDCVSLLLKAGANLSISTSDGGSPLHAAAEQGHPDCLRLLLNSGADSCIETHPEKITALHLAAQEGHYECLEILISAGAKVDAKSNTGSITPLCLACGGGHAKCCEVLLVRGADANHVCEDNDVLPKTPLMMAAEGDYAECIKTLVEHAADVNTVTYYTSPLILSAQNASQECIKILLDSAADVNFADRGSNTALSISITRLCYAMNEKQPAHQLACITLLLKGGADVDALHNGACVAFRDRQLVRWLLNPALLELLFEFEGNRPETREICVMVCQQCPNDLKWRKLLRCCNSPRSLMHLCRLNIRRCVGARRLRRLASEIPLPPTLKEFLLYCDL